MHFMTFDREAANAVFVTAGFVLVGRLAHRVNVRHTRGHDRDRLAAR